MEAAGGAMAIEPLMEIESFEAANVSVGSAEMDTASDGTGSMEAAQESTRIGVVVIQPAVYHHETPPSTQTTIPTISSSGTAGTSGGSDYVWSPTAEERFLQEKLTENFRPSTPNATVIVMEENLRLQFRRCQECGGALEKENVRFYFHGAHLRVEVFCKSCDRKLEWHSFPFVNGMSQSNLMIPSAVITAGKTFQDINRIASACSLSIPSKSEFYNIARTYVYPAINSCYKEENEKLMDEIRNKCADKNYSLRVAIDTRYSQPGHSASRATTSAIDLDSKKIVSFINTKKGVDATSSPGLELVGTKVVLNTILSSHNLPASMDSEAMGSQKTPIRLGTVMTDDHPGIIREMAENYRTNKDGQEIRARGDMWHFT